jgi:hypothetical protein
VRPNRTWFPRQPAVRPARRPILGAGRIVIRCA